MVEMVRKTPRATGADEPVLERAVHLTTEKKSSAAAKKPISGTNLDPIFAILQDLPDSHLLSVALDSFISFSSAAGPPAEIISIIRANELAQAALAETRDKIAQVLAKE